MRVADRSRIRFGLPCNLLLDDNAQLSAGSDQPASQTSNRCRLILSRVARRRGIGVERDEKAYAAGVEAATADIAAARLVYRWGGHAGHWGHWIVTQLAERFRVGVNEGFGVCFVSASSLSFDDGYNAVLVSEIDRRHGNGAFEAMLAESRLQSEEVLWAAKQLWLARHPDVEPGAATNSDPMYSSGFQRFPSGTGT